MRVVPRVEPSALLLATTSVPALTCKVPSNVLAPDNVHVPVPTLVTPPAPLMTPLNVVDALLPPVVNVPPLRRTAPPPASEPIVVLKPPRSSVPPLATVIAVDVE